MKRSLKVLTLVMFVGIICGFFSGIWAEEATQKININTASAEQLMDLKGVGEVLAQRIVDHRTQNGPFATVGDLSNVTGIGPKILSDNEGVITVGEMESSAKKTKGATSDKTTKTN
ncbi:MAG: helix-hairpin-helix domain-containing protein [Desulfobacterales bacterium]|jgi:competence protein ComEA|nr:helix-hairpin-helix domain-containing protein [Desulfobacterales bacterium]